MKNKKDLDDVKDIILDNDEDYQAWLDERKKETREKLLSQFYDVWEVE